MLFKIRADTVEDIIEVTVAVPAKYYIETRSLRSQWVSNHDIGQVQNSILGQIVLRFLTYSRTRTVSIAVPSHI